MAKSKTKFKSKSHPRWFDATQRNLSDLGIKAFERFVAKGLNDSQIAREMEITASGARWRRVNIMKAA